MSLSAHLLQIECQTLTPLALPAFTGSALRGALLTALRGSFCPERGRADCAPCPMSGVCPVSRLIATVDEGGARGEEAPRPYVLRPVQATKRTLAAGEPFSFGLTLIGDAAGSFPYVLQGLRAMGETGFGLRQRAPGRFRLERVTALNPFVAAEQIAFQEGRATVYAPALAVTQTNVSGWAALQPGDGLTLDLQSPLRLVASGALVQRLTMGAIVRRLLRRLTDLCAQFSAEPFDANFPALLQAADAVATVADETRWVDLESWSGRSGRRSPIGGLTGRVRFEGDLAPLLPYLGWLPAVGLGKDVTKGNGWIELG